jgi:hypothetical protein
VAASGTTSNDEAESYARFERLQQRMPAVWDAMARDLEGESVVVLPSMSIDLAADLGPGVSQAYEERLLFLLLLLRQPRLRLVYLTSVPVPAAVVDYYLGLLPGVIPRHARARLHLVSTRDPSPRPLAEKLLERPRLLRRVAGLVPDRELCHLIPFMTTPLERDVALALDIPLYGSDPRLEVWGTKSGSRRLFAEEGVPHPRGAEDVRTVDEVMAALAALRAPGRPDPAGAMVKLNEGVSGLGNAFVDLRGLGTPVAADAGPELRARVESMQLEGPGARLGPYLASLAAQGGVVEERVAGTEVRSPSVQLRVLPDGAVELLSTHDQLLGGPTGQSYLGARFPADPAYAGTISSLAARVGDRLSREGVLGRFAVDFVVVRDDAEPDRWTPYAIEVNLRKGGTTHPFLTLQFLTGGSYDAVTGRFHTPSGDEKHLVATDHLESPALPALSLDEVFDVVVRHRLHFDQTQQTGVVLHMLSSLSEGRIGLTCVGDTAEAADRGYREAERLLLGEADAAARKGRTPV